ncbi:MAG: hypothetical protein V3S14_17335, partial [Anaerolineae bacterium]
MPVTENLRKGMRAARAGRKAEATAAFQSALDQDPTSETALLWLGYLADDPQVSLAHITKALESHVQSPRAYTALQWAWRRAAAAPVGAVSGSGTLSIPRPIATPVPPRHRQEPRWAIVRLPAFGVLLLLLAMVGGVIGFPLLKEPPAIAALASAFTSAPQPTVTVDVSPSAESPAGTVLALAPTYSLLPTATGLPTLLMTPTTTLDPTDIPLPTITPSSTPSPVPTPSLVPTPAPAGLVVPE